MIVPSLHFVTLADFKLTVVTCSVVALFDICIYMLELAIVSCFFSQNRTGPLHHPKDRTVERMDPRVP